MSNPICPYCNTVALCITGKNLYPHRKDLYKKIFYKCNPCEAWVGCHPNTDKPLGRLANAELRKAKSAAHQAFDPLWRHNGGLTRSAAYQWLATAMNLPPTETHIGMFNRLQCMRVVDLCNALK